MEVEFHEGGHHTTRLGRHQYPAARPSTTSHWDDMHQSATHQAAKAVTAITAGGSLMILSALTLTVAVIGLTIATPLLVIFSPILVPAVIAMVLIAGGFMAAGGLGVASISVLSWIYRYVTGRHPVGADQIDEARMKIAGKARDMRDRSADWAHHHNPLGGRQYETTTTAAA